MIRKLAYHFPYYFATVFGAALSIILIFMFERYLEASIFVNYFKSYVVFQVSLILLELGGYTKLQQYIKIDSKSNNIGISLIAFQNVIFLTLSLILLVKEGVIFASFFMIQALLYSNYIWYYTAIDKEKSYYLILIIFRILIVITSLLLIFGINILPFLILLMLGKIITIITSEKWKIEEFFSDLLFFFKLNKSVGATNLVTQIGNRFIDISIFQVFPEKELIRIGLLKPILDRLGSMITQHIVNREMIRSAKNLSPFRILKIFSFSIYLLLELREQDKTMKSACSIFSGQSFLVRHFTRSSGVFA